MLSASSVIYFFSCPSVEIKIHIPAFQRKIKNILSLTSWFKKTTVFHPTSYKGLICECVRKDVVNDVQ